MNTTFSNKPIESVPVLRGSAPRILHARYDAAQTTAGNAKHWSMADAYSADMATNPGVRRTLRMRSQYEFDNNGYCRGIVNTIANDNVGVGPQLQLRIGTSGLAVRRSQKIEKAFATWGWRTNLAAKMRLMVSSQKVRGEVFVKTFNNGGLAGNIDLDVEVIEADQVVGFTTQTSNSYYDGIHYDTFGNAIRYEIARTTAGSISYNPSPGNVDTVDAEYVYHYFKRERPGQRRGIPETTPALPLFATLRRWTLATLEASETAANHAGVFTPTADADDENSEDSTPSIGVGDVIELERNGGVVVPAGYGFSQLKPEQPTAGYGDFEWCVLRQISRTMEVPIAIATLDSSKSNLASRYVDDQYYVRARKLERFELEGFMEWLLAQWIREAAYVFPELRGLTLDDLDFTWRWPSLGDHADPSKVANAQQTRMQCGLTHLAREFADDGLDAEQELPIAAATLGLTLEEYQKLLVQRLFTNGNTPPGAQPVEQFVKEKQPNKASEHDEPPLAGSKPMQLPLIDIR